MSLLCIPYYIYSLAKHEELGIALLFFIRNTEILIPQQTRIFLKTITKHTCSYSSVSTVRRVKGNTVLQTALSVLLCTIKK